MRSFRPMVMLAPLAGKALEISAAAGEYRNDTTAPAMTIADLRTVWVTSDVPENSLRLVNPGEQVDPLFNVIAGAMAIPTDLKEASSVFRFGKLDRWRLLILPGVFPYFVTGMVTAAGGAWNASIVAEYFHFKGQTLSTTGLGATISQATDAGNFDQLLAGTIVMAAIVVTINRLLWRRLYRLAQTRFKLEV
jgi:NitT/TauT family transport system permease protein